MAGPTTPVAVTGATGRLGGRVARLLADAGTPLRLLVRDPRRAPGLPGATVHVAPYADAGAVGEALDGVEVLFMVSAAESEDRAAQHEEFVAAAAGAGVRHVVYTSFLGAAPDATFTLARTHARTEADLAASGMGYTFLRDSFYMDLARAIVGEDGVIRGPAGRGRCAFVAHDDIARTAALVLRDPAPHAGRAYLLTGPEALTLEEVARTVSEVEGIEARYEEETVEEAYASRRAWDPPPWQAEAWVSTYTAIAAGELDVVSGDIEALTGTAPMTFREYLAARR
ncbi:SDR family oxidoreductase [Citricoccus sp. SGAir0253]|uniref:SDR family oxidoreductase n=1 Tax=Citricoccus sp. SGAir0253 TaxID=2567881 RepID=UPI0010CD62D1|nr:SDR family oxidoreductase [Citricoccus sp. SGAir0253]QCU78729.1 SDR family oxidoreductase [Citricoccus sp. SGAir0253]